jgi:3-oxoacyl-[acyl-carrier protein] reductase
MSGRLDGKCAIVTGAGRGIGAAIAKVFAREGASVLVTNRSAKRGEQTTREIVKAGGQASFLEVDVTDRAAVKAMAGEAVKRYGRLDILAHNAGIFPSAMVEKMTEDEWNEVIDTNLTSAFRAVKACLPQMKKQSYGRIVITSSITGPRVGYPGWAHYGASKAGLNGFIRSAALEFANLGITINGVEPGNIQIRPLSTAAGRHHDEAMRPAIPVGHLGEPDDIAHAALYLASDEAKFVTGQTITVDGGQILPEAQSVIL